MTSDAPAPHGTAEVTLAGRTVTAEFRAAPDSLLAGGPVRVEVTISVTKGEAAALIAGAARATGRSREYSFTGTLPTGGSLKDPYADAVEVGGVQTSQPLAIDAPVVEHILLNQFLTLEDALQEVDDGGSIAVVVDASRQIRFEASPDDAVGAQVSISLTLHRDDAAVADHYRASAAVVMKATQVDVHREQLVVELCTARNSLVADALRTLTHHPDGSVAARARQALDAL